jgi:hypothetical protein
MVNAISTLNTTGKTIIGLFNTINPGLATYAGQMDTAIAKTNSFAGSLTKLQTGVAILGALALGYTIGQLIEEGFIEPARKKEEKKRQGIVQRGTEATLRPQDMTDAELEENQKQLWKDLDEFKAGNDAAGRRVGLNPKISEFFTPDAELEEREMIIKTAEEGIGAIEQEKRRRKTGLPALDKFYEKQQASQDRYFDPTIVRNEQLDQWRSRMEYGQSSYDATTVSEQADSRKELRSVLELNTEVTIVEGVSDAEAANIAQREIFRKLKQNRR